MARGPEDYRTPEERTAQSRVALAYRYGTTPDPDDVALVAAAMAARPIRHAAAALLKLAPEQRARVAELVAEREREQQEGAAVRSA
jgi:hypothetical protein